MLTRRLGKTEVTLPVLGFGAMELRNMNESDSIYLLGRVLDLGVSFIDTSPDYTGAEEFIGKAVSHRRNEFVLASKCGCNIFTGEGGHIFSREQFQKNLDHSLKLLRTDHIDIWQIHGPVQGDLGGPMDDAIDFMREQKKAGKIGTVSVSFKNGGEGDPLYPAGYSHQAFGHFLDYGFDSIQTVYGGLTRDCERDIAKAGEQGIGVIARGILNRYTPAYADRLAAAKLGELCGEGEDVNAFLIRFAITTPGVTAAIVGSSSAEHMKRNVAAAERGALPHDVYLEAGKRLEAAGSLAK
jgi:aryl-alcohol dehydrogenase-like predicted oxidoreductase